MADNKNILFAGALLIGALFLAKKFMPKKPGLGRPGNNAAHLATLHPQYKDRFLRFYNLLVRAGYNPQINSSYRDFNKQAELKRQDRRNAAPGLSHHNYGLALDIQLLKNGKVYGKNTPPAEWIKTGLIKAANNYGLAWGGLFPGYPDSVHFYINIPTEKLQQMAFKQFKTTNPKLIQGNQVKIV